MQTLIPSRRRPVSDPPASPALRRLAPPLAALFSIAIPLVLLPALLPPARAAVERFEIHPEGEGNLVQFESRAPLERIVGKTRGIRGWIEVDPEALGDSARVQVEVDLATLDTGISLRDQHMRDNHLETGRFPQALFRGARIFRDPAQAASDASGAPGATGATGASPGLTATPLRVEIAGEFELHGIRRPLRLPVSLSLQRDGQRTWIAIECRFRVNLSDFAIPRPKFLVMKLSDDQEIVLTAVAERREP